MSSTESEKTSRWKLAKLVAAIDEDLNDECVEAILQMEGDVNYAIPHSEHLESSDRKFHPGTVLHQLKRLGASKIPKIMNILLKYGLDITKTNSKGQTVLHAYLAQRVNADNWDCARTSVHPIVESVLSAHVDRSIHQNPCDDHGISHFHFACMTGHTRAVEFFLDAGVDVDMAINLASPIFPGCSPLHVAVIGARLEAAKILLDHGANVYSKDAEGLSPVSLLVKRNLAIMNWEVAGLNADLIEEYEVNQRMLRLLLIGGEVNNNSSSKYNTTSSQITPDEHGFTNFHAACTIDDTLLVENLLMYVDDVNQAVSSDSPLWPGYTPLHFAAHFNVKLVKLLFAKGGNLMSKDAKGVTPFDIFLQRHRVDEVHALLAAHSSWRNILMSDGRTKLLDLLDAMKREYKFQSFLDSHADPNNLFIDESSPLWPGYTTLHLAVLLSERVSAEFHELRYHKDDDPLVEEFDLSMWRLYECLDRGASSSRGSTPIHLAFYAQKSWCVSYALDSVDEMSEVIDDNGVSLLHIACDETDAVVAHEIVERAIAAGADVNLPMGSSVALRSESFHPGADSPLMRFFVVAGSTPLHMAVSADQVEIAKLLLRHGADVNAANVEGWTPLHVLALMPCGASVGKAVLTFTAKLREQSVEDVGLSHLHVACHVDSLRGAKKLIKLGSDVNAVVRFDSTPPTENYAGCRSALDALRQTGYAGFTPLHFAVKCGSVKIAKVLLEAGADVLAKNTKGVSLLQEVLTMDESSEQLVDLFVGHLQDNESLQQRLQKESGVTLLHVLVFRMNVEEVGEVDVNAKVKGDSPMWPGCTVLHTWMHGAKNRDLADDDVRSTLKVLLDAGVDVTMSNEMLDTPLHLFDRSFATINDEITLSIGRQLLSGQKDFDANPTNASGVSHFHIAVRMREVGIVEKFLEHAVDIDQRIDVLSNDEPGCSALHLLAYGESIFLDELPATMETFDLLLRHGADVRARDVHGNTPLHALAEDDILRKELFEKIIQKARGLLNAVNVAGDTPFAVALKSSRVSAKEVEFFLKRGCRVNAYNSVDRTGLLASAFLPPGRTYEQLKELGRVLFQKAATTFVDESGRTAIHNVVSLRAKMIVCEKNLIEKLVRFGCDIDAQDRSGKTALHTAAQFKNERGVSALLLHGADVNIIDNEGKTAFDYALEACTCGNREEQHYHEDVIESIWIHVKKLRLLKLDVHERNIRLFRRVRKDKHIDISVSLFLNQVNSAKHIGISESYTLKLHDFLSETGAVATYWTWSSAKRSAVYKFFTRDGKAQMESIGEVRSLLQLQYRKALKRGSLVQSAFESFGALSGIRVPELCCELLRYLSLSDVRNLIASANN